MNGLPHTSYDFKADTRNRVEHTTLDVSDIKLQVQQVTPGVTVCMELLAPCDNLFTFCMNGQCRYSVFNTAESCCPVGDAAVPL